uniref:Ig-like domain-containing protein n=1 Tax=Electrophorus electricus TaxID=8005 RepID=A0AAY5EEL8_ELEEL
NFEYFLYVLLCFLGTVTLSSRSLCALTGSTVKIPCKYTSSSSSYRQSSQNDCSMTITHLRESDAHTYRFRFHTDSTAGKYTGRPGVSLSVTDLKITVSDRSSRKHLICSSTCTLPNNPTYIWYRNGQPLYNQNTNGLYVYDSSEDAGSYSCAVRGYEELLCLIVVCFCCFLIHLDHLTHQNGHLLQVESVLNSLPYCYMMIKESETLLKLPVSV